MLTLDIIRAVNAAGMAKQGILPVGGGSFDQTISFEAACRFVWHTEQSLSGGLET